jgi:hypothetical protein
MWNFDHSALIHGWQRFWLCIVSVDVGSLTLHDRERDLKSTEPPWIDQHFEYIGKFKIKNEITQMSWYTVGSLHAKKLE